MRLKYDAQLALSGSQYKFEIETNKGAFRYRGIVLPRQMYDGKTGRVVTLFYYDYWEGWQPPVEVDILNGWNDAQIAYQKLHEAIRRELIGRYGTLDQFLVELMEIH